MVLLESSEGRKRAPWMLQLVFNKILTFTLDQFWVEKHGCSGGRKGGGLGASPPLLFTLKAIPFQANSYDCMVSIFCIVLPKIVIAVTIIL